MIENLNNPSGAARLLLRHPRRPDHLVAAATHEPLHLGPTGAWVQGALVRLGAARAAGGPCDSAGRGRRGSRAHVERADGAVPPRRTWNWGYQATLCDARHTNVGDNSLT